MHELVRVLEREQLTDCHIRLTRQLIDRIVRCYGYYFSDIDYFYGVPIVIDNSIEEGWKIVTNSSLKVLRKCKDPIEIQWPGSIAVSIYCGCRNCEEYSCQI